MLNTVINMSGYRTGLLVTKGFEDIIAQGRGSQTFINAQWTEITHMQYRKHRTPLVPRKLARGATERIDMFGQVVIPLYEHEVEQGIRELLIDEECEAIAIVFLQSFNNPQHEERAAEIARRVMQEVGREIPMELSSQVAPTMREVSRANATVIQAYASNAARKQLFRIEEELVKIGYSHSLKTVLGYGGITNIRYPRLFEAAMSGPVGGLMGAKYLSSVIGEENIVCSDVGGTSFDAGAITAGVLPIDREPGFQGMYVNVPMLGITSIGAGTGTYIRLDPQTQRIKLGPDSAGGTPGPTFMEAGNTTPTINDVNLLMGIGKGYKDTYDWSHANGVVYDAADDAILVSVRHQDAVIKFSRATGEVTWILGDHGNWKAPWADKLLKPADGLEWQYHQHNVTVTGDGRVMVFDNGSFRAVPHNKPRAAPENFSRAAEFAVDEANMSVSAQWSFDAGRDTKYYSTFVGGATRLPETGNTFVTFGGVTYEDDGTPADNNQVHRVMARHVEVTGDSSAEKVFELAIEDPSESDAIRWFSFRGEHVTSLYG